MLSSSRICYKFVTNKIVSADRRIDKNFYKSVEGVRYKSYSNPGSSLGHGAGKGGGAGGSIRESGGGMGEYGAAQEEHYFFNKQRELLKQLKKKLGKEGPKPTQKKT